MKTAKTLLNYLLLVAGYVLVAASLVSLFHNTSHWFIQVFHFPRLQAFIVLVIILLLYVLLRQNKISSLFISCLFAGIIINAWYLFPYTSMATTLVASAQQDEVKDNNRFSIMLANVYMKNRQADSLLAIVNRQQPSILLTMEVNDWWVKQLQPLERSYPYKILYPTGNTYGMALYSKLPLLKNKILVFNHDSVPSFLTTVQLNNGSSFNLLTVHPVAPKASTHPDNLNDKEIGLLKAAYAVQKTRLPIIVAGDFNDVGWSANTSAFETISGLHDTRVGRGLYNTFSAANIFMRWPLDYVYTSKHFKVVDIKRMNKFGSDHYPFYAELVLTK